MRFNNVLLINPHYGGSYSATLATGLGYIAEVLKENGIEHDVLDLQLGYGEGHLRRKMTRCRPQLVGISAMTYRYQRIYQLAKAIKGWIPETQVVVGGPFVSTMREAVLRECPNIDFGVVMEGEGPIVKLCQGHDPQAIKGLIYRRNGDVVYTGDQPYSTDDIDSIPFPKYERFELHKYPTETISIVSSRGCPYGCIYCPVQLCIGHHLRVRSYISVVDELEYWFKRGYRRFGFADDNFTFYSERVHQICEEIERRSLRGMTLILGNGMRADRVDEDLFRRMKNVGFQYIAFGVEAGNDRLLKTLKKEESIEQIEKTVEAACRLGIDVKLHFLVGTPGETLADVYDSVAFALKYPVADVFFNNLIPYPGTELFAWVSSEGLLLYPPEVYLNDFSPSSREPVFATPEFSLDDRKKAFEIVDATRRKIRRNYYERKLRKFRLLAKISATVFASDLVENRLLLNRSFRKWAKRVGDVIIGS